MRFFRTEHEITTKIHGYQSANIERPKTLPQEAQIFHVEWNSKGLIATWWIPDNIMPTGGLTEKS